MKEKGSVGCRQKEDYLVCHEKVVTKIPVENISNFYGPKILNPSIILLQFVLNKMIHFELMNFFNTIQTIFLLFEVFCDRIYPIIAVFSNYFQIFV